MYGPAGYEYLGNGEFQGRHAVAPPQGEFYISPIAYRRKDGCGRASIPP